MFLIATGIAVLVLIILYMYMAKEIHQRQITELSRQLHKNHRELKKAEAYAQQVARACQQMLTTALQNNAAAEQNELCRVLVQHVETVMVNAADTGRSPRDTLTSILINGDERLIVKNMERNLGQWDQKLVNYWNQQTAAGYVQLCFYVVQRFNSLEKHPQPVAEQAPEPVSTTAP